MLRTMRDSFICLILLVVTAVGGSSSHQRQSSPAVTIRNGTIIGSSSQDGVVDSFKGIPFAQPPTGSLRLRPPQPLTETFGTIDATGSPRACPQFLLQVNYNFLPEEVLGKLLNSPLVQNITNAGEDCLTINVQRPATASPSSKLPVLFWLYGGGFETGSTSILDGSNIVRKSIQLGQPVIYVAVNYRLGGFGFLAGRDLAGEGSTNLGLRDQRLGMQWVAENIAAFGGDPSKVTIWGESAGSFSVYDHLLVNGGDNTYRGTPLFRGAIMNSGAALPSLPVTSNKAQDLYNMVLKAAGCVKSTSAQRLSCLRGLDYTTFLNAVNSVPSLVGLGSLTLSYLPRPDPGDNFFSASAEVPIENGRFAKVPIIIGNQEDEGTGFSLFSFQLFTNEDLVRYLANYFPEDANVTQNIRGLLATYPDQPFLGQPAGSPFGSGPLYNLYPQYKRLAASFGDITLTLNRRVYLQFVTSQVKAWSYLSSFFHGLPILGTFHGSDVAFSYGTPGPITDTFQTAIIGFTNNLDPNSIASPAGVERWPEWNASSRQLLNILPTTNRLIPDNFRQESYEYIVNHRTNFHV